MKIEHKGNSILQCITCKSFVPVPNAGYGSVICRECIWAVNARVSFNGRTLAFQANDRGSNPLTRSKFKEKKMNEDMKHREMIGKCFELIKADIQNLCDGVGPMPSRISIPYEEDGKWVRLSVDITPIRDADPEPMEGFKPYCKPDDRVDR